MTVHLSPAIEEKLQSLAAQEQRTADELAQEALESFVTSREEWIAAVKEGDDDFERGEFLCHEEVFSNLMTRLRSR